MPLGASWLALLSASHAQLRSPGMDKLLHESYTEAQPAAAKYRVSFALFFHTFNFLFIVSYSTDK